MTCTDSAMRSLLGRTVAEIKEYLAAVGEKPFRAAQIADWLYKKRVSDPLEMRNLPASLREKLSRDFATPPTRKVEEVTARDGTSKLLLELADGECIEMVLIPSPGRMTFCLSTQVGCPVGCRFCASGANGLKRNLTAAEILEELYLGAAQNGGLPDNIVFMGIGEGLLNFEQLSRALFLISDADYIGLSPRRITVSTSGYVPGMHKLAALEKPFTLAISLHAPDEATRAKIIPDPLRFPISEILLAADEYAEKSGRMVTLEYTLLAGVNDSPTHAHALARLARQHHAKINLIACNPVNDQYKRPSQNVLRCFLQIVEEDGAHVTMRVEKGTPESAACGQLRIQRAPKDR